MICIFALILVLIILKHPKYTIRKIVLICVLDLVGGAIEICLSQKGALAKNRLGNTVLNRTTVYLPDYDLI